MTSTTSDHLPKRPLGLSSTTWALVISIILGMVFAGVAIGLLLRDREAARQDANAVAGQSQQLVECVRDPATTTSDCEQKANEVEETIDQTVAGGPGPAGAPGAPGQDGTDGTDGVDGLDGARGQRGARGLTGPTGPTGAPGADGINGTDGGTGANGTDGANGDAGPAGATGPPGPPGDRGPSGADGTPGADGTNGRGIRSVACDPTTQQFVITFTDDTTQAVEGSDCVADLVAPVTES